MEAVRQHPLVQNDLSNLTVVQIDAHGDLRAELDGEPYSHACAAARALDAGIASLLQVGIRAYSKEEHERMLHDERITTFLQKIPNLHKTGPITGIDGCRRSHQLKDRCISQSTSMGSTGLVPATGTPVPGLTYWQVQETIQTLFNAKNAVVVSADVNEIGVQEDSPLTQFTAAMLATNVVASHVSARRKGTWKPMKRRLGPIGKSKFQGLF